MICRLGRCAEGLFWFLEFGLNALLLCLSYRIGKEFAGSKLDENIYRTVIGIFNMTASQIKRP